MKTLVVYSNLDGFAVQLKNHVEDALEDLGIEWKECYIDDVKQASEAFTPTMHMFFHPNKRVYDFVPVIKELKGHKLLWTHEDPYESDITFDMLPHFYYVFTSDANAADKLKETKGSNYIQFVPHACNPKVHKPQEVEWKYKSDVCFIGNAYESRLKYFQEKLPLWKDRLVTLVGVGYRGLDNLNTQHVVHGHISEEEMIKYINGSKLVLNIHRLNSDLDMANSRRIEPRHLNNRFYEVSACGKTQVVEGRDNMIEEINNVAQMRPEDYSYKARLKEYYLPLLKK